MSVGPEALRRFGPLLFLACPRGRAAVRAPRVFRAAVRAPRVFRAAACAPRVFRVPESPAARETWRPHCVRRRVSRPALALRALRHPPHQWSLSFLCVSHPGPAAAHGRRSQAHQFLRHPPHQCGLSLLCVSHPGPAAAHERRSQAHQFLRHPPHRSLWDFTELGAGCRRAGVLMTQNSRLVAVKPRLEAVWRSKCRPPRSKTPKMGC